MYIMIIDVSATQSRKNDIQNRCVLHPDPIQIEFQI